MIGIKPNYYKVCVDVRDYSGEKIFATLECNDLAISLAKKNNLTIKQAWYYMQAIKYIFRFNNKGEPESNIDKAITCLEELKYEIVRGRGL